MESNEKVCPYCAEIIKSQAVICRYCQSDLKTPTAKIVPIGSELLPLTPEKIAALIASAPSIQDNNDDPDSLTGAAWQGSWAIVKKLIAEGAEIAKPNSDGHTALDLARARGDTEIIRLLLTPTKDANPGNQTLWQSTLMDHPSEVNATKVETYRLSMAQIIPGVIGIIFGIGILLFFIGGGIENKVAKDAEAQYSIAARNGTAIDRCVHAGMVAAYLFTLPLINFSDSLSETIARCVN